LKKALIATAVVLVLAFVVVASMKGRSGGKGKEVYAEAATRRDISQVVKATGTVDPRVKVNISAHVVAKIAKLFVVEGQDVKEGQPFLELEQQQFTAARDEASAAVDQARSQQRQAEVQLADAEFQRKREENLVSQGVESHDRLEAAVLRERSARLQVQGAKEAVAQATAALTRAQDDLHKTVIYSPLSGRVISLQAKEGEVVVSGTMNNPASVIATVADLSELLAEVDVDETDIVNVRMGQPAEVTVEAIPDKRYHGRVVEIGSSGFSKPNQPDVTFFKVKVLLTDPDQRLRPGMSTRAEIRVATHPQALVVPVEAVVYRKPLGTGGKPQENEDEIKVAFTVEKGKAVQHAVQTGIADATHVEIVSGLPQGAQVITGPHRILRNLDSGDAVHVEKPDKDKSKKKNDSEDDKSKDESKD
jgi:HlyD family secretion protein